jgi:hypothetical protein
VLEERVSHTTSEQLDSEQRGAGELASVDVEILGGLAGEIRANRPCLPSVIRRQVRDNGLVENDRETGRGGSD